MRYTASYAVRVTNTGSSPDDYILLVTGLPAGFLATFGASVLNVSPGSSNFREVPLTITVPVGTAAAEYPFKVVGASNTVATITDQVDARLTVLQLGVRVQMTVPIFHLPALSTGALLLNATLLNSSVGTVTVRIASRNHPTIIADATATLLAESASTLTRLNIAATSADRAEGNTGTTLFIFTVTRAGNVFGTTTVNYAVAGSGLIPADATDFGGSSFPSGQISFASNETSKIVTINVRGDTTNEPDERFTVTLSGASGGAIIADGFATGVIRNDDTSSGFSLNCSSLHAGLNKCTILGATRGGIVNLALGIVPGNKFLEKFRVTVGMLDPKVVAQGIVQPDGRAVVQFNIASQQLLQQLLLQAFEQAPTPRTTNIVIADALLIINQLNQRVGQSGQTAMYVGSDYDVNKDGILLPIDALLVINILNDSHLQSGGEGESGSPEKAHSQKESSLNRLFSDDCLIDSLASDVVAPRNQIRRKPALNHFRMHY